MEGNWLADSMVSEDTWWGVLFVEVFWRVDRLGM
jgi:hypothetical protein